jgi:hypothetical protein
MVSAASVRFISMAARDRDIGETAIEKFGMGAASMFINTRSAVRRWAL